MATSPEKLSSGIPLLEYGDLVSLNRIQLGLSPILEPKRIPVHPLIFKSPQLYTTEFAQKAFALVPESIRQDIMAIEDKVGEKIPVVLTSEGVYQTGEYKHEQFFNEFSVQANRSGEAVGIEPRISADAINTWINRLQPVFDFPLIPKALERAYEVDEDEFKHEGVIVWRAHNIGNASLPLMLVLRNFAIMFNNLGLQELGIK